MLWAYHSRAGGALGTGPGGHGTRPRPRCRVPEEAGADQEHLHGFRAGGGGLESLGTLEAGRRPLEQLGVRLTLEDLHDAGTPRAEPPGKPVQKLLAESGGPELVRGRRTGGVRGHVREDGIRLSAEQVRSVGLEDVTLDHLDVGRQTVRVDGPEVDPQHPPAGTDAGGGDLQPGTGCRTAVDDQVPLPEDPSLVVDLDQLVRCTRSK